MKVWNPDGQPVEMEAVDARECVVFCGYTNSPPAAQIDSGELSTAVVEVEPLTATVAAAAEAEQGADAGKLPVAQLREALTARGIEFDPAAKKAALQALLDAAQ